MALKKSVWSRKIDLFYLIFFIIHPIVIVCNDIAPLYPESIKPSFVSKLQNFYITQYKDRFFIDPPGWFTSYIWLELVYHLPLSIWAINALIKDKPTVPLHLLVWAVKTAITTWTCLVEMWQWRHITHQEKVALTQLYAPYLALAVGMGLDMFIRLQKGLETAVRPNVTPVSAESRKGR